MSSTKTNKKAADFGQKLLEVLGEVDRPGDVCASGERPLEMPGLEVDRLGTIGLPLVKSQARKLIKACRQAPYGKGTETVVDTDVRRVWELDPAQFRLTNPKWDKCVASIVADVQKAFGLERQKLAAHLYKLLLYEEGGFFLPHRDGEKLDGMVATLVIGLPSVHDGGELIVRHDGWQYEVAFHGAASGHELSYAAFYADCQHEIRPVRSGYRLCLSYNLTLAKSRGAQRIAAPCYEPTAAAIGELLGDWRQDADAEKLAVVLDHRYTQNGLAIDTLKGVDRARADVLFEAAEQADCVAHLALVTLWQCGAAEGGFYDDSYGRGRRRYWADDNDEETAGRHEMGELYDWSLSADHWSDHEGNQVRLGEIRLSEHEIVADKTLSDTQPDREDFEGYTGNEGMTLERWYHRAAVVIWPCAKHFHVLCSAGTDAAVGGLEAMVHRLKRAPKSKREQRRQECLSFAAAIIDKWDQGRNRPRWLAPEVNRDRDAFPASLCELNDPDLVRRFLSQIMPSDDSVQLDKSFGKFAQRHGWTSFETELTAVIEAATALTIARNAELLRVLCTLRDKNAERVELCLRLCERMVQAVEAFDNKPGRRDWRAGELDRAALLQSLVTAMLAIGAERPLGRLIDHAVSCGKYDLTDAHLAAVFALEKQLAKPRAASRAISTWLSACQRDLETRAAEPPQEPADYRRDAKLSCKCGDCRALAKFLADPNQRQARFPLAKRRRQHLHQIIDRAHCDCTHVTQRGGSPCTLVCTKTNSSYQAARQVYQRDVKNLARITALAKKLR